MQKLKSGIFLNIDFIDIWGEGFLSYGGMITGFKNSYNINKYNQLVSNPPDMGREIPNQIPVQSWESNFKIIPDKSVNIITLMGAPITNLTANEISRIINPNGNIIIYGFNSDNAERKNLEQILLKINFAQAKEYSLSDEFAMITINPVIVYTSKNNPAPYIHDEL